MNKGGCTPTASRQASRHETKETKADVSIMTQMVCGGLHNLIHFNSTPFFASCRTHRVLTVTCLDACRCADYLIKQRRSSQVFITCDWCLHISLHAISPVSDKNDIIYSLVANKLALDRSEQATLP
jgi:hypothetical protein